MAEETCGCNAADVSTEAVSKTVDQQLASLDPQRAEAFTQLQTVRAARGAGYEREQKRLVLKYGADSPRVATLADKAGFNAGLRRDLTFEVARSQTETPTVDKDGYVFHGFVRDLKGQAVPRLTVALYDESGNWIREIGYGCTDERGYFLMRFPSGQKGQSRAAKSRVAMFTNATGIATGTAPQKPLVKIYVLDAKKTTLHVEKEPLQPERGQVDFRIIVLGAEGGCCTEPPPKPGPVPSTTSTPLENIRGIGPATARKMRSAGIKDIETLLQTDTAKLVEIAGFDAHIIKHEAGKALKKKPR